MSKPVSPPSPTAVRSPAKPRAKPRTTPGESARAAGLFLDNQLCFSLYATSLAMTKVYRPLLAPLGLTYPQYVVMLALWEHGELTAGGLGERVALDSGTLVPLVRKLVSLGLLQRQRSASDDRSVLISLTSAGARMSQRAHGVHAQIACATQCTEAELNVLMRSLQTLRASLLIGAPPKASAR